MSTQTTNKSAGHHHGGHGHHGHSWMMVAMSGGVGRGHEDHHDDGGVRP